MTGLIQDAGGLLMSNHARTVWPLIVVPLLVYALSRAALALIGRMAPGSAWSVRLSFWAAITPGLAFMGLAPFTLRGFDFHSARHSWGCFVHCYGLAFIFLAVPLRAGILLAKRRNRIDRLIAAAGSPSPRLAALQTELHIPVRELPTNDLEFFLAGIFKPVVCVSHGAVTALAHDELRAALLHEKAHWQRRETLRLFIATFLNECTILPVREAVALYRRCAEFAADHEASKNAHPFTIASALLSFARFRLDLPLAVNLAGQHLADRVSLLLGALPQERHISRNKSYVVALLTIAAVLAFSPSWIERLANLFCAGSR